MIIRNEIKSIKAASMCILIFAAVFVLCSCKAAGKNDLIKYAKNNYGACEFIRQEHSGSGKDEVRTVYLRDKETGIEYYVTSGLDPLIVDGSTFGHLEDKGSDFPDKYKSYLMDLAEDEITDLKYQYAFDYEYKYDYNRITFLSRVSGDEAKKAAESFAGIIKKYDTKDLFPADYTVYAEQNVYVGQYDAKSGEWVPSGEYEVIDYVHSYYDDRAVFSSSMGCYIDQFLPYDEVDRLFPGHDGTPSGKAYYFRDSEGDTFVAVRLEDFGGSAKGIRLFKDRSYGMEEIYI